MSVICVLSNFNAVDTASAVAIALMTFGTMYPMSVYSGKVLLQVRQTGQCAPLWPLTPKYDAGMEAM